MASWRLQTGVQHQYQSHCKQTFGRCDDVQRGFEVHPWWAPWGQWKGDSSYQWWLRKVGNSLAGDIIAWERGIRSWIPTWIPTCPITTCCTTSSTAGGTICDSYVRNARICIELCGCTAQYSSDPTSGTYGTSGFVDLYAPCSNWGRSWNESATTATFGFDGGRWIRTAPQSCRIANSAPPWKQTFRDVFEWVRPWLHSSCWWIPPQVARWISSKVRLVWQSQRLPSSMEWNHSCIWAEKSSQMDQSGTLFDGSCSVSVRSSENRFHSLEVHPAIAKSAEPCSWKSKGVDCKSSELDCKSLELDCTSF